MAGQLNVFMLPSMTVFTGIQNNTAMLFFRQFVLLAMTVLCVLGLSFFLYPEIRSQLMEEDHLIENVTAGLYLFVAIVALVGLFFTKQKDKKIVVFFFVLALFVVLEELSYGERIFGFTAPRVFDYKMDTVHDVFFLFFKTRFFLIKAIFA